MSETSTFLEPWAAWKQERFLSDGRGGPRLRGEDKSGSRGVVGCPRRGGTGRPGGDGAASRGILPPPLFLKLSFLLYLVRKILKRNKNAFF